MNARLATIEAQVRASHEPLRNRKWAVVSSRSRDRVVYLDAKGNPLLGLRGEPVAYTQKRAQELADQFNAQLEAQGSAERVRPMLDSLWWELERDLASAEIDTGYRTLH